MPPHKPKHTFKRWTARKSWYWSAIFWHPNYKCKMRIDIWIPLFPLVSRSCLFKMMFGKRISKPWRLSFFQCQNWISTPLAVLQLEVFFRAKFAITGTSLPHLPPVYLAHPRAHRSKRRHPQTSSAASKGSCGCHLLSESGKVL